MPNRNDPAYQKARRKFAATLMMFQSYVLMSGGTDDDEYFSILTEDAYEKFDRLWDVKHPVKQTQLLPPRPDSEAAEFLRRAATPIAPGNVPTAPNLLREIQETKELTYETKKKVEQVLDVLKSEARADLLGSLG